MGLFDLFKKKETPEPSSTMMEENQFWSIIGMVSHRNNDLEVVAEKIREHLETLSSEEIIGFHLRQEFLRHKAHSSEMWCAGYVLTGYILRDGDSFDLFEDFKAWVIGQGREAYYVALENPDSLIEVYDDSIEDFEFGDLLYVADKAFENKTDYDINKYIDYKNFTTHEGNNPEIHFNWIEDDEESMRKICPRLMEVAWEN